MTDEELTLYRVEQIEQRQDRIEGDHQALAEVIPVMKEQVTSLGNKVDKLDAAANRVSVALYSLSGSAIIAALLVALGR